MKYLLLFLLLPLFSFGQSVDILPGLWVRANAQGGSSSNAFNESDGFLKYNFTDDGFVNRSTNVLFDDYKLQYKLADNVLKIGGVFFHVISLKPDTLIMSLSVEGKEPVIYTILRVQNLNIKAERTYNPSLKDSVYKANSLLFPQSNATYLNFMNLINAKPEVGKLKINFIVN